MFDDPFYVECLIPCVFLIFVLPVIMFACANLAYRCFGGLGYLVGFITPPVLIAAFVICKEGL